MPQLDVRTDNDAEIFIMDQTLSRVARSVGSFQGELEPGLYKIRVSRAGTYQDQVIELGGKPERYDMSIGEFSAIAPIESKLFDMNPVNVLARAVLKKHRTATILVLAHGSDGSVDRNRPFGGASIFPWSDAEQAVRLDNAQRSAEAGGQLWSAIAIKADPTDGPFVLELRNGSWVSRQAILLAKGRQTRIFLRARNQTVSDPGSGRSEPDAAPFDISVQMARPASDVVYGENETTAEVARSALERGRAIFNSQDLIDELLDKKYENPIAGMTGLHLLLDAKARSDAGDAAYNVAPFRGDAQEIADTVLVNLTGLLQPDRVAAAQARVSPGDDLNQVLLFSDSDWPEPPDLTALRLRAGRGRGQVLVQSPPMLRVSWDVLKQNAARDGLTWIGRELWNVTGAAGAVGPYLAWSPGPHSLERTLQRIGNQFGPLSVLTAPFSHDPWEAAATMVPSAAVPVREAANGGIFFGAEAAAINPAAGGLTSIIDGTAGPEVQMRLSEDFGIPLSILQDTVDAPWDAGSPNGQANDLGRTTNGIRSTSREGESRMKNLEARLQRLRAFNAGVSRQDRELARETADIRPEIALQAETTAAQAGVAEPSARARDLLAEIAAESIVMRRERPILAIRNDRADLVFKEEADSAIWKERLERAAPVLDGAIRAAGRIELSGGDLEWVGTGWLVHDDILVTNRHVAVEFARRDGLGFVFKQGSAGPVGAAIDFLEEIDNTRELVFRLLKPLHIEEASGPDVAFFQVELTSGDARLATPLKLASNPALSESIAVIGYPAFDGRIPDVDLMEDLFGRIYNKKRLAPGAITAIQGQQMLHNATTLGGNSGSVVFDLASGEAFGLHFSGRFMATNYAVPSDIVRSVLEKVVNGGSRYGVTSSKPQRPPVAPPEVPPRIEVRPSGVATATITIPVTLSISIGIPRAGGAPVTTAYSFADVIGEEAAPDDYRDREGYRADFLGADQQTIPLPAIAEPLAADVLSFPWDGGQETELRYEHFSVVMSKSRRMCIYSAVNIDGGLAKKTRRSGWRWDPRIPRAQQIMNECYGDPPRFSRGHMTRREDPAWGDDATAKRGNADSMHVTNATPQMQSFNAPVWLELEDYALGHAREDRMTISVFTGPYFTGGDPLMYGVRIPLRFWKIIAFIHDDTGKLCATGYEMGQEASLRPQEEFVFGQFPSSYVDEVVQLPIATIEKKSGVDFGRLAEADPLAGEWTGAGPRRITNVDQVQYYR